MTATIIIGLLIPLLGTMLGSAFVLMMKTRCLRDCKRHCWALPLE